MSLAVPGPLLAIILFRTAALRALAYIRQMKFNILLSLTPSGRRSAAAERPCLAGSFGRAVHAADGPKASALVWHPGP